MANIAENKNKNEKRSRCVKVKMKDNIPQETCNVLQRTVSTKEKHYEEDDKIYAKSWACSFRKINDNTQRIYAKKAIEDILFFGALNQLTTHAVKMPTNKTQTKQQHIKEQHIFKNI